jgi:predicted nucleotidyltransferase
MNDTLLMLQKQLPENTVEILRSVKTAADRLGIPSFIVGATARDIVLEYVHKARPGRATSDVDFGIAVETWDQFETFKKALIKRENFRADNKMEQRLWRGRPPEEMKIDLIPYGKLESPPGTITFPPTGFELNTNGFREAFNAALTVEVAEDLQVKVVSLAGLAVLKFIAYDDRPQERQTDLEDVLFVARSYLDADNEEKLYADDELLRDEDFDLRTVGARLLGRDMADLLTERSEKVILTHLSQESGEPGDRGLARTAEIMMAHSSRLDENVDLTVKMLHQLRQGITERR